MRLRIATLLVGHQPDVYMDALEKIDRFFEIQLANTIRTTIVIDNSLPRTSQSILPGGAMLIGGDNSFREFSAWDRGLAQLDRMRESPDLVHLVTSAFDSLYTGYLARFDERLLKAASANDAAVGHVDFYDDPIEITASKSQHWMRTSFFFLPRSAVPALRSMVSFEDSEALFSDDPTAPFRKNAPVSRRFQKYIVSWLTGDGTGQGVTWHSRFDLTNETLLLFRHKALAIINEHLLSVRLREAGHPMVDVGWLASEMASNSKDEVRWNCRWQEQLADRLS